MQATNLLIFDCSMTLIEDIPIKQITLLVEEEEGNSRQLALESLDEEFYIDQFNQLKLEIKNLITANSTINITNKKRNINWKSNKYEIILEDLFYNVSKIIKEIQEKTRSVEYMNATEIFEKFERYASDIRKARYEIYGPEKANNSYNYGWGPNDEEFNDEYYYGYDEGS